MSTYTMPELVDPPVAAPRTVYTVASGDLRLSANVTGWPTQQRLEADLAAAVTALGWDTQRAHPVDTVAGHGFIDSQHAGIEVFQQIPLDAPLMVVEAVWQYSHHVLPGCAPSRRTILLVANWSGQLPGLVACSTGRQRPRRRCQYSALGAGLHDEWAATG